MDDIECKSIHLSISLGNSLDDWELSCSSKFAKSRSKSRSHRRGGKPSEGEGSAQLVHSRATLKVPCSNPRRISVSTPATRRVLSYSEALPTKWVERMPDLGPSQRLTVFVCSSR